MVEINVARLIGATEECACGPSGSQLASASRECSLSWTFAVLLRTDRARDFRCLIVRVPLQDDIIARDYSVGKDPAATGRVNDS